MKFPERGQKMIKFLIGGSPCTHWSIAQCKARETEPDGIGWELFKNYLIAKEKFRPDFFLYENNKSAAQSIKDRISEELETPLQYINSALVSAQNRWRFYAHNIPGVEQPEDRHIMLADILESGIGRRINEAGHRDNYNPDIPHIQRFEVNIDPQKTNTISTVVKDNMIAIQANDTVKERKIYEVRNGKILFNGVRYEIALPDGFYTIRPLTVTECCRLQTLPDNYCRMAKKTHAYRGLGNGWTAEVIIHILSHALAGIPKNEEKILH
jgi:site-specific DNA-cytosine methylase